MLLADDDVARVSTRALEGHGYRVHRPRTGGEVLALIAGLSPVELSRLLDAVAAPH